MSDQSWKQVMAGNIARFEVAAQFDGTACWNAEGSASMAKLLNRMCEIVDDEIARRSPAPQPNTAGLTLSALQRSHIQRQDEWCPEQKPDLSFRGNEMGGECGEAQNVIKKLERERLGWRGSRDTVEHLGEELADVIHCAILVAITAGIDIERAAIANFNRTSEKHGLTTRLTPARPTKTPVEVENGVRWPGDPRPSPQSNVEAGSLLPCPFCGVELYSCTYDGGKTRHAHEVNGCVLDRRFVQGEAQEDRWNRRAPSPQSNVRSSVSREEAIEFLNIAARNWDHIAPLSEDDIGDVATALLWFANKRPATTEGSADV